MIIYKDLSFQTQAGMCNLNLHSKTGMIGAVVDNAKMPVS